jgi:hypothetical protein
MKKFGATIIALMSIPFLTFGLLFLIGTVSAPSRVLPALALLAIGTVLLISGVRRLRRLASISLESLMSGAVEMASRMGGELTLAQLQAEYGIPQDAAQKALDKLTEAGTAVPDKREDRVVYVFTGLLPAMARKLCPYCGTELPVRESLRKCPNCGAQLEITKT